MNIGALYLQLDEKELALEHLERANDLHPGLLTLMLQLAAAKGMNEQYNEARELLLVLQDNLPTHANIPYNLGRIAYEQGDYAAGLEHFDRAIQVRPDWHLPHNKAAWIHATSPDPSCRDSKAAISMALKSRELEPNFIDALDTLAAAYAADGQFDKAVETQQEAISQVGEEHPSINEWQKRLDLYKKGQPYIIEKAEPEETIENE